MAKISNVEEPVQSTVSNKRGIPKLTKFGASAIVLLAVFGLGINVGNGRLQLPVKQGQTGLPAQINYSSVNDVYDSLKTNYNGKLNETQILDGLKHGLAESTNDPYTEYFTAKEAKTFDSDLNSTFSGIGAELSTDDDKNIIVTTPLAGFPAEAAGLKAKDIIISINGKSTQGMTVNDAVKNVRGEEGTTVKLEVVRDRSETLTISIVRKQIQVPSVKSEVLDGNIGYLQITSFATDTSKLAEKAAEDFKKQGVKGIVVDLRNDPGGYLDQAIETSSLWLPKGKVVVDERGTDGNEKSYSTGNDILTDIPTVVLINGGSASASEIMAGALRDNKEATVIGEKSYGKGVVQQLVKFPDGSQLKVTVASWYRPNGQNINHKGITPDQIVKISDEEAKAGTDTQLNVAKDFLNK